VWSADHTGHNVAPPLLSALPCPVSASNLITLTGGTESAGARFVSLLGAAARLSPQELIFDCGFGEWVNLDLPCFPHAMSIEMSLYTARLTQLPDGEFSELERLAAMETLRVGSYVWFLGASNAKVSDGRQLRM
jgi:hypothetical protein